MLEIIDDNTLGGIIPPSDCEKNFNVKWLSGTPTGSFYIGDSQTEKEKIKNFITGKHRCKIDMPSLRSYANKLKQIVIKFKNMFYGPVNIIDSNLSYFNNLPESDQYIIISYTPYERYLKTSKYDHGVREFKYSLAPNITYLEIKKTKANEYVVYVKIIDNWREEIMKKVNKCDVDSMVVMFNEFMSEPNKKPEDLARLFGIKYALLLNNNSIDIDDLVHKSNFSDENIAKSLKNGIVLSKDVVWEEIPSSDSKELVEQYNDFNVYGIHITGENSALDENNPHICIGWSGLGDLTSICDKDGLYKRYSEINPEHSNNKKGANVSQIWMFKEEMKVNDYVVYFDRGTAHIGRVLGDYQYIENMPHQNSDYVNNRKVEWIKSLAYKDLPEEYSKSAYVQKSFFRLESFKPLIQDIINGKDIRVDEFDDVKDDSITEQDLLPFFDFTTSSINDGQNLIVYGTPGCGKSYYVEHTLLKDYPKENYIRTTFFQDYTNTDFVGQILPKVEGEKVTYEFNPGPFTLALEQAIRKPNERIALVIEELNRGSAASIFGDIFQLLDRKNGVSEYSITNVNVINYLEEKFKGQYLFSNIKLPGNLSIFATMNTSDQNVFILDTAFKRRWRFKKLLNEFDSTHAFKSCYIPGANITWQDFVNGINAHILRVSTGLNSEDKQLGVYFVEEKGMREDANVVIDETTVEDFAYKVLEYLWADVAKFDRTKWFNEDIKCLDDLVKEYKKNGIGVFNHDVFNK